MKKIILSLLFPALFFLQTQAVFSQDNSNGAALSPVPFGTTSPPLYLVGDPRLNFGKAGSFEIGFSLNDPIKGKETSSEAIFSLEGDGGVRIAAHIDRKANEITVVGEGDPAIIPYDFTSVEFIQLALVTNGGTTDVFINTELAARVNVAYRDVGSNLSLILGGNSDFLIGNLVASVFYFRAWKSLLTTAELQNTYNMAFQSEDAKLNENIVLSSAFTNAESTLLYNAQPSLEGYRLLGVGGKSGGTQGIDLVPPGYTVSEILVYYDEWVTGFQTVYRDQNGGRSLGQIHGRNTTTLTRFKLKPGETIRGINGRSGLLLDSIQFVTNTGRTSPMIGGTGGSPFNYNLPRDGSFEGFSVFSGDSVDRLSVVYKLPPLGIDLNGTWVDSSYREPVKNTSVFNPDDSPHGTFTDQSVFKVFTNDGGETFLITSNDGHIRGLFNRTGKNTYALKGRMQFGLVTLKEKDGVRAQLINGRTLTMSGNFRLEKVSDYNELGKDQLDFSGTFSLDHRIAFDNYMFQAYNLAQINPYDLQDKRGHSVKPIFTYPKDTSKDYYFSAETKKNVPFGMTIVSDNVARGNTKTRIIKTSQEHSKHWSNSVGFNIGVPEVFSFSASADWQGSKTTARENENILTLSKQVFERYAMVTDFRHIRLDPGFRQAVLELNDISKSRSLSYNDYVNRIIQPFGTHYAYATTFGGLAFQEMQLSKNVYREAREKNYDISAKVEASYKKKINGGANAGHGQGSGSQIEREMSQQSSKWNNIGGESSSDGGFSLGNNEVPILLDLRPLGGLLTHFFFYGDVERISVLSAGLDNAIQQYMATHHSKIKAEDLHDLWEPYLFEFSFNKIEVRDSDEFDDDAELYGNIYLTSGRYQANGKISQPDEKHKLWSRGWKESRDRYISEGSPESVNQSRMLVVSARELCTNGFTFSFDLKEEDKGERSDTRMNGHAVSKKWADVMKGQTKYVDLWGDSDDPGTHIRLHWSVKQLKDLDGKIRPAPKC